MAPKLIKSSKDLQTKRRAVCDGFLNQALAKTEKAEPFVEEAKKFQNALDKITSVEELLNSPSYKADLAAACGFSEKARSQLTEDELDSAIKKVLTRIHKEAGEEDYKEEVLFRYLLTKGDSLGGSMRNLTGSSAGTKLTEKIIERLGDGQKKIKISKSAKGKVQRVSWDNRTLLFDVKPALIGKNIDVILINSSGKSNESEKLNEPGRYLACGELKGGIDPAGADEHWKTANSALGRIRSVFKDKRPGLFFVGAAIEASMAEEIFDQLNDGKLTHAANLNEADQLNDLVDWLISL